MSEYRIIQNVHGYAPQRRTWFGWDGMVKGNGWLESVIVCPTVEEARAAIDNDIERRKRLDSYTDGAVVEYYNGVKAFLFLLLFASTAFAQQPASYIYADATTRSAKQLGFVGTGIGGGLGGSFNLPHGFTLREDLQIIRERKVFESSGRTVNNYAAVRYYRESLYPFFAESGIQVVSHTNLPAAVRLNLGVGAHILNSSSWMPTIEATVKAVKLIRDIHDLNGVKFGAAAYHNFASSPFGVFAAGEVAYSRFHDVGSRQKHGAVSGEIRFGFFINLTAIKGA